MGWQVCIRCCFTHNIECKAQLAFVQDPAPKAAVCASTSLHVCNRPCVHRGMLCLVLNACVTAADCVRAEEDRLEVRRQTREQDKHLDTISDALSDLQRIGEVSSCNTTDSSHATHSTSAQRLGDTICDIVHADALKPMCACTLLTCYMQPLAISVLAHACAALDACLESYAQISVIAGYGQ